jgi:hypothetical protein
MEKIMETNNMNETRRSFLKKVVYVAPAIVALGALATPSNGHAANSVVFTVNGKTVSVSDVPAGDPISDWNNQ